MILYGHETGFFSIVTNSGSHLILDVDGKRFWREPLFATPAPNTLPVELETDGSWIGITELNWPIEPGKQIIAICEPPMNWYKSTPVAGIMPLEWFVKSGPEPFDN